MRNDEFRDQPQLIIDLANFIKKRTEEKSMSSQNVADRIKRAQSYAYNRLMGKAPWTITDLDELAPALGYKDIFALWRAFDTEQRYQEAKKRDSWRDNLPRLTAEELEEATQLDKDLDEAVLNNARQADYEQVAYKVERENEENYD